MLVSPVHSEPVSVSGASHIESTLIHLEFECLLNWYRIKPFLLFVRDFYSVTEYLYQSYYMIVTTRALVRAVAVVFTQLAANNMLGFLNWICDLAMAK